MQFPADTYVVSVSKETDTISGFPETLFIMSDLANCRRYVPLLPLSLALSRSVCLSGGLSVAEIQLERY